MRLIDADAAADLLERTAEFYRNEGHDTFAMNFISDAVILRDPDCFPTVDAVEVVRCKDCKEWRHGLCRLLCADTPEDGYCFCGAKMDRGAL